MRKFLKVLLLVLVMGGLSFGGWQFYLSKQNKPTLVQQIIERGEPKPEYSGVEGRYLFSGTIVLARAVEKYSGGDYNQPFSKLNTFSPEKYDVWMADLECPVTNNRVSYQHQIDNLVFNCRPEWLPAMSKYFKLANISGNHTHDMGAEGFPETVEHLQKAGIQAIGNYTPREKKDLCEVVALPVRLQKPDGSEQKGLLPVAFCAFHYFSFDVGAGELETIDSYARVMPVFGFMHAGTEYLARAQPNQVDLAHRIIDRGAEFLIGNSPHWVQNTEVYKGKLIAYSTGNFIFDQIDAETKRGASIGLEISVGYDENVQKWLDLGQNCAEREDTCLEEAEKLGLKKVNVKISGYEAIANTSGYLVITEKGGPALQKAIEERLNWANTLKELGTQ